MVRRWGGILILLAVVQLAAAPVIGQSAAPDDIEHWVALFEDPERVKWQHPGIVLSVLGVGGGQKIADLGAGTGYFTRNVAWRVGQSGKVWAIDTNPAMLQYIEEQNKKFLITNVETVLAEPNDPKLPAGEADLILVVNTWHHIEKREPYLKRLAAGLAVGGRVAIVDFHKRELPVGPPPDEKLSRKTVIEEFEKGGWQLVSESVALPYQYLLTFMPGD